MNIQNFVRSCNLQVNEIPNCQDYEIIYQSLQSQKSEDSQKRGLNILLQKTVLVDFQI